MTPTGAGYILAVLMVMGGVVVWLAYRWGHYRGVVEGVGRFARDMGGGMAMAASPRTKADE